LQRDLTSAVTLFVVAAAYYALARELDSTALADEVGPSGLPLIYAAVLAVLAALLGLDALVARARTKAAPAASDEPSPGRRLRRAAGVLAIGVGYLAVMPLIGYPFAVALAIAATALHEGERPSVRFVLVAGAGAAALYVLFDFVLGVEMPAPWNA
jgi:putative tricarboxylic transport membrane protein